MNTAHHHTGLKFSSGSSGSSGPSGIAAAMLLCALMLAGCGSTSLNRAPVEDRRVGTKALPTPSSSGASSSAPASSATSSASSASMASGQPGTYTVKPGDTLIKIGLDTGQSWRDIRRWNNIDNPNQIEVGQVLRVAPPGAGSTSSAQTAPVQTASVQAQPKPAASQAAAPQSAASPTTSAASSAAADTTSADDAVSWSWPVHQGAVLSGFDEVKNKGVDLAGNLGDPVLAAADGRVVYSGAGLRGYGNLIILKHNNTYLTAYAHNQTLLVKEDQTVRKGQKIAEMGNSDADRIKLHFELRRQGKPVDPLKFLPAR